MSLLNKSTIILIIFIVIKNAFSSSELDFFSASLFNKTIIEYSDELNFLKNSLEDKYLNEIASQNLGDQISVSCFYINMTSLNVWNLTPLKNKGKTDYQVKTTTGEIIYYNFCANTYTKCGDIPSQAVEVNELGTCTVLSGDANSFNLWEMMDENDISKGVTILMNQGGSCNGDSNWNVKWDISCDKNGENGIIQITNVPQLGPNCLIEIEATSYNSCPIIDFYFVTQFIEEYKIYIGIGAIIIGLFLCIFGVKYFWATIIMLLCICFTGILFIIYTMFSQILSINGNIYIIIGIFVVGIGLGFMVGCCLKQMTKVFFILFGGAFGFMIAIFCYNAFLSQIHANAEIVYWVTVGVLVIIGAILGYFFMKVLFVFLTSILGSYLVVRSISFWVGGFPSESMVIDLINRGEWDALSKLMNGTVYGYLGGWLALFVLSLIFQFCLNKDLKDDDFSQEKKENENNNAIQINIFK